MASWIAVVQYLMDDSNTNSTGVSGERVGDLVPQGLLREDIAREMSVEQGGAVQEKLNEYKVLVAPVERAIRELQLARGMLRARAEDELNALSPALSALSEALNISTLDLLSAQDRGQFLQDAVVRSQMPIDDLRRRIVAAGPGTGEHLESLGISNSAA